MRCPNCGGHNSDRASYCVYCGRDLTETPKQPAARQQSQQPPYQQPRQGQPVQGYPPAPQRQQPPYQQPPHQVPPASGNPAQGRPATVVPQQAPQQAFRRQQSVPVAPPAPAPPAPFPPRTMAQLQELEQGALPYTVASTDTTTKAGRKKVVRIVYPKSAAWLQVATLLKAFKEQQETSFETIVIQGNLPQDPGTFAFTNGQLIFDRNVRLGSQTLNRYQIETGNGYESDSVRIVLSE